MDHIYRARCYGCFRPKDTCFCAAIPTIDNRTEVLILQHLREWLHPFNTARIVHRALTNSRLLADYAPRLAAGLPLKPRAGLLFPGRDAALISDVPSHQHPEQLVILDGTWHHAETLLRDIPALRNLPRYRLAPDSPSRYRIRREPNATSLSTVEATVAALRVLEPETCGLEKLLDAFHHMVDRQLAHPKSEHGWRQKQQRGRTFRNIPLALLGDLRNIVVAYGESFPGERGRKRIPGPPVYWVAQRLATGERFACAIRPDVPLHASMLAHLDLTEHDFAHALPLDEARKSWANFQRPADILTVYNQSTASLLSHISPRFHHCLVLKSVDLNSSRQHGTLDEILAAEGLVGDPAPHSGRAGKRLANAIAFVRHLNALGNAR